MSETKAPPPPCILLETKIRKLYLASRLQIVLFFPPFYGEIFYMVISLVSMGKKICKKIEIQLVSLFANATSVF